MTPLTDEIVQVPPAPSPSPFERPVVAPPFEGGGQNMDPGATTENPRAGLDGLAKLLADALRGADSGSASSRGRKRPAWDRRKALVCVGLVHRERIARVLVAGDYEVFVAENTAQALGRMREERMDVVLLDGDFDPLEQGVAFITREVKLLRPSERRRLFFVYLTPGVRTMDLHAAFLQNVNLVVNTAETDQLAEALDISIRNYNELYRDLYLALDVAPI